MYRLSEVTHTHSRRNLEFGTLSDRRFELPKRTK